MDGTGRFLIDLSIIALLFLGVWRFRTPWEARRGNLIGAFALLCAVVVVLHRHPIERPGLSMVIATAVLGTVGGWIVAVRVNMIQIPAMVAFQHGAGGVAAFLISFIELTRDSHGPHPSLGGVSGLLGLIIGAGTFSASMVAGGKLANRLRQTPIVLRHHGVLQFGSLLLVVVLGIVTGTGHGGARALGCLIVLIVASALFGIGFSIRVGGADMPVLISFLNATAGLAAAFCGLAIQNRLLIACGATVAASGSILTHVMCKAMHRDLGHILRGIGAAAAGGAAAIVPSGGPENAARRAPCPSAEPPAERDPFSRAVEAARAACKVIIVPGYGMALAGAQFVVAHLVDKLVAMGKDVKIAIHPVAGRMPGHMHVVLAEAEVEYDRLYELEQINDEFGETDLVLIVGACDVVNPAAISVPGTPISGMPILRAHEAKHVVVCNLDEKPGYSGVRNSLYDDPKTILLLGDAQVTVARLLEKLV